MTFIYASPSSSSVNHETNLRLLIEDALKELDESFGIYDSGRVISGNKIPSYKDVRDREDPLRLTQRVLIYPMMSYLGYSRLFSGDVLEGRIPGTSLATVSMNSVLSSASSRMMLAMNADSAPKGIATDGFRWILAKRVDDMIRVTSMSDLRPYYVEILDRNRFRVAEMQDDTDLLEFVDMFSNNG